MDFRRPVLGYMEADLGHKLFFGKALNEIKQIDIPVHLQIRQLIFANFVNMLVIFCRLKKETRVFEICIRLISISITNLVFRKFK